MVQRPRIAFVTGKLAEPAMRAMARELEATCGIDPTVIVLNIQVAALLTAEWVSRKLTLPPLPDGASFDKVMLPGHCRGDVRLVQAKLGVPVEAGPVDLYDLPETFGGKSEKLKDYGKHRIDILAEINHAPRLTLDTILALAARHRANGADIIDVGCDPQADRDPWPGVGDVVRALRDAGHRVSIDSFHPREVSQATKAGAELVLSVNGSNVQHASEWGTEVVAIPDTPADLDSLDRTMAALDRQGVAFRVDPVIEPIGLGFAASLQRYITVRQRYPDAAMMMGVGNLTEMTEVDSAGVNALLIGLCEELAVTSVLTTEVINWARSSVAELDVARRLMHHAVRRQTIPKHVDQRLVMLRDAKLRGMSADELDQLAASLTDRNIRIFAVHDDDGGRLHAMNRDFHLVGADPFDLYDQMLAHGIDEPTHAFYLGYEMAKAVTALTLGKQYTQDRALRWGLLTREEKSRHEG